jgi:hypothetical protein
MAQLSTYYHKSYDGGLNTSASAQEIDRDEASLLRNWDITYHGQLRRRDGRTQVGSTLTNVAAGLHTYFRNNGSSDLLVMDGTSLKYLNSTTFDALDSGFTSGKDFFFEDVQVVDKVFIGNEDNQLHSWDRSSTTLNSCLTDLGAAVPHGNIMRWHKNHMFHLNNVNVSGTKYQHRIYWSALGDPTTYDTANDFFEVPGNGRLITCMDLGDTLVLFKERAIQYLSGWGDTDWRVTATASNVANLDEQVGTFSPRGAVRVGNEVWFIDDEGVIRRIYQTDFDAFRRDVISTKLVGTLGTINKAQLAKARAWSNNDKVYFAVPTGAETNNDLVLVFDIKASKRKSGAEAWTTYTGWNPVFFTDYPTNSSPLLYIADTDKKIYSHTGDDDGGVAIDARWDGKDDDYDKQERWKRYKFGYINGPSGSGDVDVEIHASVDSASFADLGDLNLLARGSRLGPTGSFLLGPTGNNVLGGNSLREKKYYFSSGGGSVRGKTMKLSIRHNVANEQPTVNTFTVHFKERSLR